MAAPVALLWRLDYSLLLLRELPFVCGRLLCHSLPACLCPPTSNNTSDPRVPPTHIYPNTCSPAPPAQAKFLRPDSRMVDELVALLESKKIGIVAHFYMDPEVQVRGRTAAAGMPGAELRPVWPAGP